MDITQAEWEIMRVLWNNQKPVGSQIVYTVLKDSLNWSESTVKTLLSRLVKKEYITYERVGKTFLYSVHVDQMQVLVNNVKGSLFKGCHKDIGKILIALVQDVEMTKEDAKQLITSMQSRLENLPDEVDCCCKKGQCHCAIKI